MESWREQLYDNELYHHGILGMRWGVRRYQNPDGTLTAAGRKRLYKNIKKESKKSKSLKGAYDKIYEKNEDTLKDIKKDMLSYRFKEIKEWKTNKKSIGKSSDIQNKINDLVGKYGDKTVTIKNKYLDSKYDEKVSDLIYNTLHSLSYDEANKIMTKQKDSLFKKTQENKKLSEEDLNKISDIVSKYKKDNYDDYLESEFDYNGMPVTISIGSDHNQELIKKASAISSNEFLKGFNETKARERITKEYYDPKNSWPKTTDNPISRSDFKKQLNVDNLIIDPINETYTIWYDGGDPMGYHSLVIEGDMKTYKPRHISLEG